MSGRAGGGLRDRHYRENAPPPYRPEAGRSNAPPSRHLWVGNLSHSLSEDDLTQHFVRFGELDKVAFQRGRSYAFINYKLEEDAVDAMRSLQGIPIAGNPLRIEFAKADKSSSASYGDEYSHRRDEQRSASRGTSFQQRDFRARHPSPEPIYSDRSKMSDKNLEPSEVLWIGFPASLHVDEMILRKAFSPFGEIEKITTFPGRSYAFIRFRSVLSAGKAKDTLHGRLFGNPRVHICFAKSEAGSSSGGRSSTNASFSPQSRSRSRLGSSEKFQADRNNGHITSNSGFRSPDIVSDLDSGDLEVYNFNRDTRLYAGEENTFERRRTREVGYELGASQDVLEQHIGDVGQRVRKRNSIYGDKWDLPDDGDIFHRGKRLHTGSFPLDNELPEYPFSDLEQEKRAYSRSRSEYHHAEIFDKSFELGPLGHKRFPDQQGSLSLSQLEKNDQRKSFYENSPMGSNVLPSDRKRFTPEYEKPSLKEWKWEGTLAKGGNPICCARCFPVGKIMDFLLPKFIDCTARTSLDMLAKHYYEAAGAWVVFFVPESDAEIGLYNEFMHYLEEKQRAAVSRLDEDTTLFLVPPSEFSEKVLKVPGRLSISGVVLRLGYASGTNYGPPQRASDKKDASVISYHGNVSYPSPSMPSRPVRDPSTPMEAAISTPSVHSSGLVHSAVDFYNERIALQENPKFEPEWHPHSQNAISGFRNASSQPSYARFDPVQDRHAVMHRAAQQANPSQHGGQNPSNASFAEGNSQETKQMASSSLPLSLQSEQLAQLASTLIGQQRQGDLNPKSSMEQKQQPMPNVQAAPQFGQVQQQQQQQQEPRPNVPAAPRFGQLQQQPPMRNVPAAPQTVQQEHHAGPQTSQQMQGPNAQEGEGDTQRRLQATLQLAAALLQQIQNKGN